MRLPKKSPVSINTTHVNEIEYEELVDLMKTNIPLWMLYCTSCDEWVSQEHLQQFIENILSYFITRD